MSNSFFAGKWFQWAILAFGFISFLVIDMFPESTPRTVVSVIVMAGAMIAFLAMMARRDRPKAAIPTNLKKQVIEKVGFFEKIFGPWNFMDTAVLVFICGTVVASIIGIWTGVGSLIIAVGCTVSAATIMLIKANMSNKR